MVEPTFNQMMNKGDPQIDVEHKTICYRGRSVALTDGQGIPNHVNMPSEQYNGIARYYAQCWLRDNTQTQISLC